MITLLGKKGIWKLPKSRHTPTADLNFVKKGTVINGNKRKFKVAKPQSNRGNEKEKKKSNEPA